MRKLALCLVAMGFGCGGGGDPSLQQFFNDTASIECQQIFQCCDSTEIMDQFQGLNPPITTESGCVNSYQGLFQALLLPQMQASIDNGRMVYHADLAGACIDALDGLTCAEFSGFSSSSGVAPAGCSDPFEGLVADGDPCASDNECQSSYCEGDSSSQEGTCKQLPGDGAACPDFDCADGFWCDFATGGGTCVATKADGTDCNGNDECQSGSCVDPDPNDTTPGMCGTQMICDGM